MNPNQNTTNSQDVNEKIDPLNETEAQTTQQSEAECQNQALVIEQLQRQINELQTELTSTKQNERDSVLRAKAEVENMRRRADMDVEKAHKFALEKFASSLLPVVDTLERGIELADQTNSEKDTLREGMELTLKALLDVLDKFGIVTVNDCNVPFNPEFHEAMTVMESAEHQPNHIMMVLQKGYSLNGRLLRPARVAISK